MEDISSLLRSFTENDFSTNVDLHIHSTYSDGKAQFESIIKQAKSKGYKKIAIADHNTVEGHLEFKDEILIPAVEFDCWCGYVFFHLLAYGINPECEELRPFLAKNKQETEADIVRIFAKRDVKSLITAIHNAGGLAVLAHPACCWAVSLDKFVKKLVDYGLDGIEVFYPYKRHRGVIKFHLVKNVKKVAQKYNLIQTGGTDCHELILSF